MSTLPNRDELAGILDQAVARFNGSLDRETLLSVTNLGLEHQGKTFRVAHEQAISHRLAFYLECAFRQQNIITDDGALVVDCEYNQHLFDQKRVRILLGDAKSFLGAGRSPVYIIDRPDVVDFEIRPDILIHKRGVDGTTNLMVLEVKRWSNRDRKHDELKLELLTRLGPNTFGYALGAAVYVRDDYESELRVLTVGPRFHEGLRF